MAENLQQEWDSATPLEAAPAPAKRPRAPQQGGLTAARAAFPPAMMEKLRGVGEFAAPAIMPTSASVALPAALTAIAGPANAPFIPLEQGAGSMAGTYGNKLLGISDPSAMDYALSGGLPIVAGYGANALRAGSKFFPPGKGAEIMQPMAMQAAVGKVDKYRSGVNVSDLFKTAEKQGARVPLENTAAMVNQIKFELADATPAARSAWQSIAKKTGIEDLASTTIPASPARIQSVMADIGKLKSQASREGGLQADKLGKLFTSCGHTLEKVPKLEYARKMFKRESVLNEIDDAISGAYRLNAGQEVEKFSPNKVINALNDGTKPLGKFFGQAFDKSEKTDILDFFRLLNKIPGLSPPQGVHAGSMKIALESVLGGSLGAAGAHAIGAPPAVGWAVGAGGGLVGGAVADTAHIMWQAWKMPGGKELISSLLKNSDNALTPQVMGAIGSFIAAKMATPPTQPSNVIQPPTGLPQAFQPQP